MSTERYDFYMPVHKGMRRDLCNMLIRLGATDFSDATQAQALLADLRALLDLSHLHLQHENTHVHPPAEERAKGLTSTLARQHTEHEASIARLRGLVAAVESASPATRPAAAHALYLHFSTHVAQDLAHMGEEELAVQPKLHDHFTDGDLLAIEGRIIASMKPEETMTFMRSMIPAMNRAERARMLGGMKQGAPPEVFNAVMQHAAKPTLSEADWRDLAGQLGYAA